MNELFDDPDCSRIPYAAFWQTSTITKLKMSYEKLENEPMNHLESERFEMRFV